MAKKIYPEQNVFTKVNNELTFITSTDASEFDYLELDELTSQIWKYIIEAKGCTRDDILDEITEQYEVDYDELSLHLNEIIEELKSLKMLKEI